MLHPFAYPAVAVAAVTFGARVGISGCSVNIISEADGKAGLFAALLGLLAAADMAGIQVDFFTLQVQVAAGSQTRGLGIQFLSGCDDGIATDTADLG